MKKISLIIVVLLIISSCSSTKLNSYDKDFKKIKTQAELSSLKINQIKFDELETLQNEEIGIFNTSIISDVLIDQLKKIPAYVGKIIKNSKKKYTQTYEASNSLTFNTGLEKNNENKTILNLPSLDFRRKIFANNINANAIELKLVPHQINGNNFRKNDTLFVFKLADIKVNYTKAKTTEKYPFVNLIIEIKATYYEKGDKNKITENEYSSSITIPVKNGIHFSSITDDYPIYSKPFKINNLKTIEMKVTETNPYHLKLEEQEQQLSDNESDITALLTKWTELLSKKE